MSDKDEASFYQRFMTFGLNVPSSLGTPARHTAVWLWAFAKKDGSSIYPSIDTLRKYTGLGRSAQSDALKALTDRGYLIDDGFKEHAPGLRTKRRKLNLEKMARDAAEEGSRDGSLSNNATDQEWVGWDTGLEDPVPENHPDPLPGNRKNPLPGNHTQTKENKPNRENKRELSPRAEDLLSSCSLGDASRENATDLVQKAYDLWNRRAVGKLHKALKLDGPRRDKLKRRLKEYFDNDLDKWDEYLITITSRPFLCGQNDRGWRADLAFALRPESILKILEGGYVDRDPTRDANGFTHVRTPL